MKEPKHTAPTVRRPLSKLHSLSDSRRFSFASHGITQFKDFLRHHHDTLVAILSSMVMVRRAKTASRTLNFSSGSLLRHPQCNESRTWHGAIARSRRIPSAEPSVLFVLEES